MVHKSSDQNRWRDKDNINYYDLINNLKIFKGLTLFMYDKLGGRNVLEALMFRK